MRIGSAAEGKTVLLGGDDRSTLRVRVSSPWTMTVPVEGAMAPRVPVSGVRTASKSVGSADRVLQVGCRGDGERDREQ